MALLGGRRCTEIVVWLDKPFDVRAVQAVVDRLVGSAWGSLAPRGS